MTDERLAAALRSAGLDDAIVDVRSLGGGCIADVRRVRFDDGRSVVVKIGTTSRVIEEATGLRTLADTGTVATPAVLGIGEAADRAVLVLEDLGDATRATVDDWIDFGRRLADMHATPAGDAFGFDIDNHLGDTPQSNRPASEPTSWAAFLRERRLGPMRTTLAARGALADDDHRRFDDLDARLDAVLPDAIRPGLVHGDLWSGNVHPTPNPTGAVRIAVIDPATHRADPLFELGMMRLFGGFPTACEAAHLARLRDRLGPDATEAAEFRIELGRLHHLLNHWLLFGAGYAADARRTLDALNRSGSRSRP